MDFILLMKHEMLLIAILVILLIAKVSGNVIENFSWIRIFNGMFLVNCIAGWFSNLSGQLFDNMFITNDIYAFEKNILNTGVLIISLSSSGWFLKQRHLAEFYILLISSLIGMFLMISSGNLLMFYLSVELSSIPLAAMCNFNHDERRSSEAAMKMIFSSAFSSCLMLLGISFLYGASGTLDYAALSLTDPSSMLITGFVFFLAGLIFKLSVVPFHFWTADVYEGSPVVVASFLSVISKGSMVFVFASLLYHVFPMLQKEWYLLLCLLSILTMITGNLFAIRQQNLKRFLAFSSITQIGFILIGISGNLIDGFTSSVYFIVIYVFSNLAAFAVVSRISELTGKETISQYRGLVKSNPVLAWIMAIALFSLAGIPPTAGFFGKIFLLTSGASGGNYALITFAALNMIISLYYYLRVIRSMFMEKEIESIPVIKSGLAFRIALFICVAGILITGFFGDFHQYIYSLGGGH
jgi:NADH-quinone oxidoreductase subunit N